MLKERWIWWRETAPPPDLPAALQANLPVLAVLRALLRARIRTEIQESEKAGLVIIFYCLLEVSWFSTSSLI